MSDISDTTNKGAGNGKAGASWLRIWWPALLICGIVAGVLSSSLRGPRHGEARTLKAINALAQAIERFEDEYGLLPDVHALVFETDSPNAAQLIMVVLGKEESGAAMQNPRQIPFLALQSTKTKGRYGLYYSAENNTASIYDSWGNPLRVILRDPGKQVTVSKPALVLSRGPDGKWGTKDDLISGTASQ